MGHRLKEHKRALSFLDAPFSAVADHAMKEGYDIAWKHAKVIDACKLQITSLRGGCTIVVMCNGRWEKLPAWLRLSNHTF